MLSELTKQMKLYLGNRTKRIQYLNTFKEEKNTKFSNEAKKKQFPAGDYSFLLINWKHLFLKEDLK